MEAPLSHTPVAHNPDASDASLGACVLRPKGDFGVHIEKLSREHIDDPRQAMHLPPPLARTQDRSHEAWDGDRGSCVESVKVVCSSARYTTSVFLARATGRACPTVKRRRRCEQRPLRHSLVKTVDKTARSQNAASCPRIGAPPAGRLGARPPSQDSGLVL
eukprot:5123037-Prymnesium_polylepis.1